MTPLLFPSMLHILQWRQETVKGISHLLIWSPMTSRLSPLYSFSLSTHLTVKRFSVSRWWSLKKESPLSRSPGDLAQLLAYSQLGLSPHPHPSLSSERNPRNLAACLWDLLSQEGFIFPYPSDSENWELEWIRIFFFCKRSCLLHLPFFSITYGGKAICPMIKTSALPCRYTQAWTSFLNIGGITKRVTPSCHPSGRWGEGIISF